MFVSALKMFKNFFWLSFNIVLALLERPSPIICSPKCGEAYEGVLFRVVGGLYEKGFFRVRLG